MPAKGWKLSPEAKAKISAFRSIPQAQCICLVCGRHFETHQSEIRRGRGKFCSKACEGAYKSGVPRSTTVKNKISVAKRGVPLSEEHRRRISEAMRGKPRMRK